MTIEKKGIEIKNKGLLLFGIILLVVGLVASFYQEQHYVYHVGYQTVTPYQSVGIILAIAGIIFVALGFFYPSQRPSSPQKT
jgi:hypothetical protein